MDNELQEIWGATAVDALEADIGTITRVDYYERGIYYVAAYKEDELLSRGEYYVVEKSSTIISAQAKAYGVPVRGEPNLLLFQAEKEKGGYRVIEFEIAKYRVKNGLPLGDLESPRIAALYDAENYPEYYGPYPAPMNTPFGNMLRYKTLKNGVFWIETDEGQHILALCYPIWSGELNISDTARSLGELTEYDKERGIETTYGYMFFSEENSCIPLFELLKGHSELKDLEDLSIPALMNAIWTYHTEYAVFENSLVQQGARDFWYMLLSALQPDGELPEPTISIEDLVAYCPDAGTKFLDF